MEPRKIQFSEIRDGDKLRVDEFYSSYGSNEYKETFFVTAKIDKGGVHLIKKDGTEKYHGFNSSYEYLLLEPNQII